MTIQNRFNKLMPYLKGLKIADKYRIVETNLKNTWSIKENDHIQVQIKKLEKTPTLNYNMFFSDTKSFDEILDWLENDIINYNLEIEQKEQLLRMKVEELKRVFENKPLDELNNLKFTTNEDVLNLHKNNNIDTKTVKNEPTKELSTKS